MVRVNLISSGFYSFKPPAEPEQSGSGDIEHGDSLPNRSTSNAHIKPPQLSETKNADVTESISTTILVSEPNQSSEPPFNVSVAETQVSVACVQGNTSLTTEMEKDATCPSERNSSCDLLLLRPSSEGHRLTPLTDSVSSNEDGSSSDLRAPSPVPDGYITPLFPLASPNYPLLTVPHLPYTGYTAITIPFQPAQPPLPEKQHVCTLQDPPTSASSVRSSTASSTSSLQSQISFLPTADTRQTVTTEPENHISAKFVQDTSKFWYKPGISRDQGKAEQMFLYRFICRYK